MSLEIITYKSPKSLIAESFRTLRTNLQFTVGGKNVKTLLITSSMAGEGKSWTASNLAVAFAQSGKRVLLIDADMRKGRQHKIFGISKNMGLSNYLSGVELYMMDDNVSEEDVLIKMFHKTDVENLFVMSCGSTPPNPSELMQSEKMKTLIKDLKEVFDIVIFDGPPSGIVTDGVILSSLVDSVVLVSSYRKTKTEDLKTTRKAIENVGGQISGVVLNRMPVDNKKKYGYYYG